MAEESAPSTQPRKKGKFLKRAFASVATVAVLGGGWWGFAALKRAGDYPEPLPEPSPQTTSIIHAFNTAAYPGSVFDNPFDDLWENTIQRQKDELQDPATAAAYNAFLAKFDQFRGEPIEQMAKDVNALEQELITYNDNVNCKTPGLDSNTCARNNPRDYFWPTPVETAALGQGNCIDEADLQEDIMRYLGVSEDDMVIAAVNADGSGGGPNHAVLLVDVAPGPDQDYLVMNDSGTVLPSTRYVDMPGQPFAPIVVKVEGTSVFGWGSPYVLAYLFNTKGQVWVANNNQSQFQSVPQPLVAAPAIKKLG
jgi:hypothetical protein